MPYYDADTFRTQWGKSQGSDTYWVDVYFPDAAQLGFALEAAEGRVYSALTVAGHDLKSPASYSTVASVPGEIRRACFIALKEEAYGNRGMTITDYLSEDQLDIFRQIREGEIEIPGVDVDDTTRAVGGVNYTEKGISDTSSSRYHANVFGRKSMSGNF